MSNTLAALSTYSPNISVQDPHLKRAFISEQKVQHLISVLEFNKEKKTKLLLRKNFLHKKKNTNCMVLNGTETSNLGTSPQVKELIQTPLCTALTCNP